MALNGTSIPDEGPTRERKKYKTFKERQAEAAAKRQARVDANVPDPWIQRKFSVGLALAFIVYAVYAFIARVTVPMIRMSTARSGNKTQGIIELVFFILLFWIMAWSYLKVLSTPSAFARDYVQKTPSPPLESHYIEDSEETTLAGAPYDGSLQISPPVDDSHQPITDPEQAEQADPAEQAANQHAKAGAAGPFRNALNNLNSESPASTANGNGHAYPIHPPKPHHVTPSNHPRPSPAAFYAAIAAQDTPRRQPSRVPKLQDYYRWCTRCEHIKPYRTHHCRHCGTCVLKMDHHCPWLGKCVDARNYKFFLNFVQWCSIFCLYTFLATLLAIIPVNRPADAVYNLDPQQIVLVAIAGLFTFFTWGMALGHLRLVFFNISTVEDIGMGRQRDQERHALADTFGIFSFRQHWKCRRRWDREWGNKYTEGNAWWLGSISSNWCMVFGRTKWRWFLPIPADKPDDGLSYILNPRFTQDGVQLPRSCWPVEYRKDENYGDF